MLSEDSEEHHHTHTLIPQNVRKHCIDSFDSGFSQFNYGICKMVMNHLSHWLVRKQLERIERITTRDGWRRVGEGEKSLWEEFGDEHFRHLDGSLYEPVETVLCRRFHSSDQKNTLYFVVFECIVKQNQLVTANMKTERRRIVRVFERTAPSLHK